ncbi:MAG: S8 family serine peptidase [Caldilineaceae bacterium]
MKIKIILLLLMLWLLLTANIATVHAQDQAQDEAEPASGFSNHVWLPIVTTLGDGAQTQATLDPELVQLLASRAAAQQTSVIVILKDQLNPKTIKGKNRKDKRKNLVQALRQKATSTQANLRVQLALWQRQGKVTALKPLWVINGIALTATSAVINTLAQAPEVERIMLDIALQGPPGQAITTPSTQNLTLINAPALWELGFSGQGIVVANMDTGVDLTHPDLAARWRGGNNSWYDPYGQHATPTDLSGHGTWTMGIMVGGSNSGTAIGVAPQAQWIAVKIFNDSNSATVSAIHQGYQWLLDPDDDPATADAPDVVNNSWSYGAPGCDLTFQPDLQALVAAEIVPVFAAGNYGPYTPSDVSPANYPEAFAVGAINNSNTIYAYSSRGPTSCGRSSAATYPNLVAPGVNVTTTDLFGLYSANSGTSFAAPHAAGALALLLSALPDLTVAQQEAALLNSAQDLGAVGPDNTFGQGWLDVLGAYQWLLANMGNQPPSVNAGVDQTITLPNSAALSGAASDDGLPTATFTTTWSLVSGPDAVTFGDVNALNTTASFATDGVYTLRLTADDGQLTAGDDMLIMVNPIPNQAPSVNAGPDMAITLPDSAILNGTASDDGLPAPANLVTTWSMVSGPGAVTFGNVNALNTTAGFATDGLYTLRLTADDGNLSSTDEMVINVSPSVAANPIIYLSSSSNGTVGGVTFADEDILAYDAATNSWSLLFDGSDVELGGVDVDAFAFLSDGSLLLSTDNPVTISGIGTVDDSDILHFIPTALGATTAGSYELYFRGADVGLTTSGEDINAIDFAPDGRLLISTLNAVSVPGVSGNDEDILAFAPTSLGAPTSGTWSLYFDGSTAELTDTPEEIWGLSVDATGKLYLATQGAFAVTGASGTAADIFTCVPLTLGANNTSCTYALYWVGAAHGFGAEAIDGMNIGGALSINSAPTNQPPTANAGADQTITLPATASLNGAASDDGLPAPANLVTTWSVVSGPSAVTFGNVNAMQTTAAFSVAGSYTLRLTANDGLLTTSDDIVVTVNPAPPVNQPPTVNAGADQTITLPATASLNGAASDDGLPAPANLVTTWSVVSGPGAVTFGNANAVQTTAAFSVAGSYTLRLTANDGLLTASDDIVITVNPAPPVNQPPTVNAGADQTITLPATASLNGAASDDGLPAPANLVTTWSVVSGPSAVTFGNVNAMQTTAAFSVAGSYTLRLTANDGLLTTSDDIVVTVNPAPPVNQPPTVNAGADQTITLPATASLNGAASDDGLPAPANLIATWSMVNGPGTVTFGNVNAVQTTASFSVAGSYTLRLTANDGLLTTSDDIVVTVNPAPSADLIYVSSSTGGTVGGVAFQDEDILAFNPATNLWSLVVDGSDIGLGSVDINAFTMLADGSLLLSVDNPVSLTGLGTVDDSDIVRFTPTSLGATTAGSFAFYLRGADVGLTTSNEDIDAIDFAPDGRLLISTVGSFSVTGASGTDADLIAFSATNWGVPTAGTWSFYFDGSAVGLSTSNEDIGGLSVGSGGKLYLSTLGAYAATGLNGTSVSGTGADIFTCVPGALGLNTTTCTYSAYWQGAAHGFGAEVIDGLHIGGALPLFNPASQGRMANLDQTQPTTDNHDDALSGDLEETLPDVVSESGPDMKQQIFLPLIVNE